MSKKIIERHFPPITNDAELEALWDNQDFITKDLVDFSLRERSA